MNNRHVISLAFVFLFCMQLHWFVQAASNQEIDEEDEPSGPCIIRMDRLPRLKGIEVGHVRNVQLEPGQPTHMVITLSIRPPIFEIPNFLSPDECDELLRIAKNGHMEPSDIFHPSLSLNGTLGPERFFHEWDADHDDYISEEEVIRELIYLRDLHLTPTDVQEMFDELEFGKAKEGNIAKNEFRPEKIMEYVSRLRKTNNKVKGRHSNQTWLYGPEYEQLEQTLIRRKAALTGLPLEVIAGSETPVAVNYGVGGHYHCHYDTHEVRGGRLCCDRRTLDKCRLCRYITILYFLNDVEEGGETAFPIANNKTFKKKIWNRQFPYHSNLNAYCGKSNIVISPKKGTAIMWYNHHLDAKGWLGALHRMSYHGACDVIKGEKWVMNNWIDVIGRNYGDLRTWSDRNVKIFEGKDIGEPRHRIHDEV